MKLSIVLGREGVAVTTWISSCPQSEMPTSSFLRGYARITQHGETGCGNSGHSTRGNRENVKNVATDGGVQEDNLIRNDGEI